MPITAHASSTGGTAHSFITTRTYDAAGRVATLTYPSGLALTYTRNNMGQVTGIGAGATSLVSAANYLPFGPLSGLSFGNAVTETWTHDKSYRATGISDVGAGAVGKISSLGYTLDAADNVTAITDNVTAANNQAFTYNTRDRLLTANGAYGAYTWTYYDYIGDRLSEQLGTATATTYGYYADLVTSVGSTKISYIGGGVVSAVTPATGAASTFTYNQANRLASATTGLGVEHYLYDGAGALFARGSIVAPISFTQFQYDLDGPLLEEDLNNAAQADYIYLNNRPVAVYDPTHGTFSYLHDDRLGTPVKATSSAAATVWSASYNPFGLIYAQSGSIVQDLRLPGQFNDPITGRYHNGWRDYNPAIGRYEEVDPLNRLAGWNVYAYADQNPLKNIDPSGLQVQTFFSMSMPEINAAAAAAGAGVPDAYLDPGPNTISAYGHAWAMLMSIVAAPVLGPAEEVVAGGICEVDTVTVGRYMSQAEYDAMSGSNQVQESFNQGVTSVTVPPDPSAYRAGNSADFFVQFDVPSSSVRSVDGKWGKIYGPNSMFANHYGITEMPPATNIMVREP